MFPVLYIFTKLQVHVEFINIKPHVTVYGLDHFLNLRWFVFILRYDEKESQKREKKKTPM